MVAWVWQAMPRLALASSVRERTRRERESAARVGGTRGDRAARDAVAAAALASPGQPRPRARRRRPRRAPRDRARPGNRPAHARHAPDARPGHGARDRLDRRAARCRVRLALRAARPTWRLAARPRLFRRHAARGRGRRLVRRAAGPATRPRVDAASPGHPRPRRSRRHVGMRRRATRALGRVAALETACGALAMTVPLALHRPHQPAGSPELGWLSWIVFAVGSSALVGLMFVSFTRLRPAREDMSLALLASLLFGAGIGYAAELSPFVVCALAAALIVNLAPRRHAVQRLLADGERPLSAVVLVIAGALLALPTAWILAAVPLLAALRIAAMWASVRGGRVALQLPAWPRDAGLATVAQGAAATALGLNFFLVYGGPGAGSGRAVLTTVLLGVVVAQAAAPPLLRLGLRAAPAPLTRAPVLPELSPNAPAD